MTKDNISMIILYPLFNIKIKLYKFEHVKHTGDANTMTRPVLNVVIMSNRYR